MTALSGTLTAPLASDIVNWGQLLEVVYAGLVAGVGISIAFSLVILGIVRATEARHASRPGPAIAYAALGLAALAVCIGAVFFGVSTMLTK